MPAPPIGIKDTLRDAFTTPSGMVGAAMLITLLSMAIVVPIVAPYDVVKTWADTKAWSDNPKTAAPEWVDFFTAEKIPRNIPIQPDEFSKFRQEFEDFGITYVSLRRTFSYEFDDFPSEFTLWLYASFENASPLVSVEIERPDGDVVEILLTAPNSQAPTPNTYPFSRTFSQPQTLQRIRDWAMSNHSATDVAHPKTEVTLFAVAGEDMLDPLRARVLKGEYKIKVQALAFELPDDLDAKFMVYGKIFGLAGTDNFRRDLATGLLWGAPVALAFGTLAALAVIFLQTTFGAISGWYGGRADEAIQRAADFLLVLPLLPILIVIALFYRPGIWWILVVLIVFGVVGGTTKVIRSLVLQIKEEQFIESARSYGASRLRILFKHIYPRVMPYTFALIALSVPGYIFLEVSLSFLGLGDPILPTWGNLMGAAYRANAIFNGYWWWIALPAAAIIFTTVAFALLGYSFDRVLNPRLRKQ